MSRLDGAPSPLFLGETQPQALIFHFLFLFFFCFSSRSGGAGHQERLCWAVAAGSMCTDGKGCVPPCGIPPAFGILPGWSRRQVRAEGPLEAASRPRPQLISRITQEWHLQRARAPEPRCSPEPSAGFTPTRRNLGTAAAPGPGGVGAPPDTSGLPLMSPPESLGERGCQLRGLLRQPSVAPRGGLPPSGFSPQRAQNPHPGVPKLPPLPHPALPQSLWQHREGIPPYPAHHPR